MAKRATLSVEYTYKIWYSLGIMSAEGVDKVLGVNLVDGSVYCYPFDNRRIPDCTRRARVVLAFIKDGFFEWMPDAVEMIQYIRELFANGETVDRRSNLTGM